ncbi:MAG: type II toxin-antitoxin system VapC family toxin [Bacillota bacterium]
MKVVIDTNIIIDHLRNVPKATQQIKEIENGNFEGIISTITVMELLAAPRLNQQRIEAIKILLGIFDHVPVDGQLAAIAGNLLSKYRASHGLNPMDAIIAATALIGDAVLFTLNTKHFRYIEGLVSINPYMAEEG